MPMEPEAYVHRIGRTGRAGLSGQAISFCCIDEVKHLNAIEKLIGKRLAVTESPWPTEITTPSEPQPRQPRAQKAQSMPFKPNAPKPKKLDRNGNPLEKRPRRKR